MPKILFLTQDFPPPLEGGSVIYFFNIFKNFKEIEVVVHTSVAPDHENFDRRQPYKIIRSRFLFNTGKKGLSYFQIAKMYFLWLLTSLYSVYKEKIDMLHVGQIMWGGAIALLIKIITGKKYLIYIFGEEVTRFFKKKTVLGRFQLRVFQWIFRYADKLVCCSAFTRRLLLDFGVPSCKVEAILPGVDIRKFQPLERNPELSRRFGLTNSIVLLSLARLEERKGHDMVIRSLPDIIKIVPSIKYLIIGRGPNAKKLRNIVRETGVERFVVFSGFVSDDELPSCYNLCDLFIMPSREMPDGDTEGFGIVFMEANACGKPVIGGNIGGVKEAVVHGETGIIVDGTSLDQVRDAILHLLTDREYSDQLGRNGRIRAEREFPWGKKTDRVEEICQGTGKKSL